MTTAIEKAERFYSDYQKKLEELKELTQKNYERAEYLQLEIRMLNEVEIPKAHTKAVLDGTGNNEVVKLKKQLQKFQDELQEKQEEQIILQHAADHFKVQVGETAAELKKIIADDTKIAENTAYANMMHAKKQYIDAIIEQGKALQKLEGIDYKLQSVLVGAGRQKNVYSGIVVKSPLNLDNITSDGIYLPLSLQEVKNFVRGDYSKSSYDYLNKFANPKNL